ncbi:uncharacterized protein [Panulirus ornatus]|uniref:uncharacterized protein isoform X2 n=1 Tax=Panulirus ornatus TaxID=150431 RepID=UPI003A88D098
MLKHVGPYRSTSSLARTSSTSMRRRGDTSPSTSPMVLNVTDEDEDCGSSPECFRRSLSSPESCISDLGSPELSKKTLDPIGSPKSEEPPTGPCENVLGSHESFKKVVLEQDSLEGDSSSPEMPKKDMGRPSTLPRRGGYRVLEGLPAKGQVLRKSFRSEDSCSLHSTCSFSSLATGKLSSRSSSTSSLADQTMTPVKVYLRFMRPDIEYKTVNLSSATTCRQLVEMLLAKFRLRHRDPNLFFLRMEVVVRGPGGGAPARRLLVLDDHARPAELQQCRPRGEARFSVGVRRGGLLRVHDSILMPGSQYKSLLVSYRTTAEELVQLLLNCYSNKDNPKHYAVHEINKNPYRDRPLRPDECPLLVQSEWPRAARPNMAFVLRRNVNYALSLKSRISWRHSLDQSSTDTDSEHEDPSATLSVDPVSCVPVTRASSSDSIFNRSLSDSFAFSASVTTIPSPPSFSSSISRVSCDSGFSSPSSSSRSSNASSVSPSPPSSPSPASSSSSSSTYRSFQMDLETEMPSSPITLSLPKDASHTRHASPRSPVPSNGVFTSGKSTTDGSSSKLTIDIQSTATEASATGSSVTPTSAPASSCCSPSCTFTSSLTSNTSPSSSSSTSTSSSSLSSSTTLKSSPSSLCDLTSILSDSLLTTCSSPPSPSSSPRSLHSFPQSTPATPPSTPRSQHPPTLSTSPVPLQRTIITIPASGPSVVTSNTMLSSTSASIKELTEALESLRTLTIRCPSYENCFYI